MDADSWGPCNFFLFLLFSCKTISTSDLTIAGLVITTVLDPSFLPFQSHTTTSRTETGETARCSMLPKSAETVQTVVDIDVLVTASQSMPTSEDRPALTSNIKLSQPPQPSPPFVVESSATIVLNILRLGMPLNASQVAQYSIILVMMTYVGRFGVAALGGATLGMSLLNATGYAFGAGLCGALETLLSHSFGHNPKSHLFGTHAQRMILLLLCVSVPLGLLMANIDEIMRYFGQAEEVIYYTTMFSRISIFGLVPYMLLQVTQRYFAAQHLSTALTVSVVVAAALNPFLQYAMTTLFGYKGAAVSWVIIITGMNLGLVAYLIISKKYTNTWGGWDRDALRNWKPMITLAMPSLAMTFSEWAAMEINGLCSGFAPTKQLAAYSVTVQLAITLWTMPSGIYIAMAVLIGNKLGEGNRAAAKAYTYHGILVVFVISVVDMFVAVVVLGDIVPRLFTTDEEVIAMYMNPLRWVVAGWHIGDAFQSNMLGILRGLGMQHRGAIGASGLGLIGVPAGLLLFFVGKQPVWALLVGPAIGVYGFGIPIYLYTLRTIDWDNIPLRHEESLPAELLEEEMEVEG